MLPLRLLQQRTTRRLVSMGLSFSRTCRGVHAERKYILPFVKLIHPDLCVQESESIRAANLDCIQGINEMWDLVDRLQLELDKSTSIRSTVDITAPFPRVYSFECHVPISRTPQIDEQEGTGADASSTETSLRRVSLDITIDPVLRQRHSPERYLVHRALSELLAQQGRLLELVGVHNPWEAHTRNGSSERPRPYSQHVHRITNKPDEEYFQRHRAQIDSILFEKLLAKEAPGAYAGAGVGIGVDVGASPGGPPAAAILSEILSPSCNRKGRNKNGRQDSLVLEVDQYCVSGNVRLSGVDLQAEVPVMQRLRAFLSEYGRLLNFSLGNWRHVLIVLKLKATTSSRIGKTASGSVDDNDSSSTDLSYHCNIREPFYIFTVPTNFKTRQLLECLRSHLPSARMAQ